MTLGQFERLSEQDQEYLLQHKAVHIGSVKYGKKKFILYQLDSFYLEIETNPSGAVFRTASFFEETDLLAPYLAQVNIAEIYECLNNGSAGGQ